MNQMLVLIAIYFSLFLSIFYLSYIYLIGKPKARIPQLTNTPTVTITIPAYNEQDTLRPTVDSVRQLSYPGDLEIIIVDDGSTDQTRKRALEMADEDPRIRVITQENQGKATALNVALREARGAYFGCVDADSLVEKNALLHVMAAFEREQPAAVISTIRVLDHDTTIQRLQSFEYVVSVFMRFIYSFLDFLSITPGVLSVYQTEHIRNAGGFSTTTLTEDYEMAMRLKARGHRIVLSPESITHTRVPKTFEELKRQRVRWYRGFITTMLTYKNLIGNTNYRTFGTFYLPITVLSIIFIFVLFPYMLFNVASSIYEAISRSMIIEGYFLLIFEQTFSLADILMGQNYRILLPLIIALACGVLIIKRAYSFLNIPLKRPLSLILYIFLFPVLMYYFWTVSLYHEIIGAKKRW